MGIIVYTTEIGELMRSVEKNWPVSPPQHLVTDVSVRHHCSMTRKFDTEFEQLPTTYFE